MCLIVFLFGSYVFGLAVVWKVPKRRTVLGDPAKGYACLCVCLAACALWCEGYAWPCPKDVNNEPKHAKCQPHGSWGSHTGRANQNRLTHYFGKTEHTESLFSDNEYAEFKTTPKYWVGVKNPSKTQQNLWTTNMLSHYFRKTNPLSHYFWTGKYWVIILGRGRYWVIICQQLLVVLSL